MYACRTNTARSPNITMIKTIRITLHCLSCCFAFAMIFALLGCNTHCAIEDSALAPFNNMYEVDRDRYGLGPLPKRAKAFIDRADLSTSGYDVMLRIYSKNKHYIAFRREGDRYKWVGALSSRSPEKQFVDVTYFPATRIDLRFKSAADSFLQVLCSLGIFVIFVCKDRVMAAN